MKRFKMSNLVAILKFRSGPKLIGALQLIHQNIIHMYHPQTIAKHIQIGGLIGF